MATYKYDPTFAASLGATGIAAPAVQQSAAPFMGPVDIVETATDFIWMLDCAGLSSKDVHVRVTHNLLQLSGQRAAPHLPDESKFLRKERPTVEKFCRVFKLPAGADFTRVKAHCEHGILTVTVSKDAESQHSALMKADLEALAEGDGSLNDEFAKVPISVFPTPALGKIVMIKSDMPLIDAVRTLSEHHILSAPVIDVNAPANAGWTEKYLGMFDMSGAVYHMLETLKPENPNDFVADASKVDALHKAQVKDAITYVGFGPFVPVEVDRGTLLEVMLLCGQHNLRRVPVVKSPGGDVVNIITQSALVQTLGANLDRFKSVTRKTLADLHLGRRGHVISVSEDEPLRTAFERMRENDISAVPVLDNQGRVRGNVSARDARLIVSSKKIYNLLNMPISTYLSVVTDGAENSAVICKPSDTLETVIKTLVFSRIHRIYVVDDDGKPLRVVSLSNILRKFVKEPEGFFGHFFQ